MNFFGNFNNIGEYGVIYNGANNNVAGMDDL